MRNRRFVVLRAAEAAASTCVRHICFRSESMRLGRFLIPRKSARRLSSRARPPPIALTAPRKHSPNIGGAVLPDGCGAIVGATHRKFEDGIYLASREWRFGQGNDLSCAERSIASASNQLPREGASHTANQRFSRFDSPDASPGSRRPIQDREEPFPVGSADSARKPSACANVVGLHPPTTEAIRHPQVKSFILILQPLGRVVFCDNWIPEAIMVQCRTVIEYLPSQLISPNWTGTRFKGRTTNVDLCQ